MIYDYDVKRKKKGVEANGPDRLIDIGRCAMKKEARPAGSFSSSSSSRMAFAMNRTTWTLLLLLVCSCVNGGALECGGGRSVRGIESVDAIIEQSDGDTLTTASCCESNKEGTCHGGLTLDVTRLPSRLLVNNQSSGDAAGQLVRDYAQLAMSNDGPSHHKRYVHGHKFVFFFSSFFLPLAFRSNKLFSISLKMEKIRDPTWSVRWTGVPSGRGAMLPG